MREAAFQELQWLLLVVEGQDVVDRIEAIRGAVSNDRNHLSVPFLVEGKYTYK